MKEITWSLGGEYWYQEGQAMKSKVVWPSQYCSDSTIFFKNFQVGTFQLKNIFDFKYDDDFLAECNHYNSILFSFLKSWTNSTESFSPRIESEAG